MHQPRRDRPRVAFVHATARFHYALAVAVQRAGMLEHMYTDWFSSPGSLQARVAGLIRLVNKDLGQRMLERRNDEIDPAKVVRHSTLPMLMAQRSLRRRVENRWEGVSKYIARSAQLLLDKGFGNANVMMAYLRDNDPTLYAGARQRGLVTVGDQIIAPAAIEHEELMAQFRRWPEWQRPEWFDYLPAVAEVERQSWVHCDHITCGSEYVKEGLVREGVAADKVSVLPYPLKVENYPYAERKRDGSEPVTVGFVGHVHLRKGVPYFVEVAKRLRGRGIRFVLVGPNYLNQAMVDAHKDVVDVVGAVPRSQVGDWLRRFDLLLFPSTCEGSATAVLEAMSTGLPVVTSPNSGTVARHGTEGFISAYDDIEAMAESVERLASNPSLRLEMGRAASKRAGEFTIDWYSREIGRLLTRLVEGNAGQAGAPEPARPTAPMTRLAV